MSLFVWYFSSVLLYPNKLFYLVNQDMLQYAVSHHMAYVRKQCLVLYFQLLEKDLVQILLRLYVQLEQNLCKRPEVTLRTRQIMIELIFFDLLTSDTYLQRRYFASESSTFFERRRGRLLLSPDLNLGIWLSLIAVNWWVLPTEAAHFLLCPHTFVY